MADMTPEEAVTKLESAFFRAYNNGYRVVHTKINPSTSAISYTGYAAITAIIKQEYTLDQLDFEELTKTNSLHNAIQRQTQRNR